MKIRIAQAGSKISFRFSKFKWNLIKILGLFLFNPILHAAQLPPPVLIRAESIEKTTYDTLYCNRAVIYWTNPTPVQAYRYRIFINGRDAKNYIYQASIKNGFIGVTLYDDTTQVIQLASEDINGDIGPLSNALSVTTPVCSSPKNYKIAILMATMADFQGTPMLENLPWNLDTLKNRYSVFKTMQNQSFTLDDWLKRAAYGKVKVTVDFFDEVVLKGTRAQYCLDTVKNYDAILGINCNSQQIKQDAIEAGGGEDKFKNYHTVAVFIKGYGVIGLSNMIFSAHDAHYRSYHPLESPPYEALLHELYHGLNLNHYAAFRTQEGCYYPKDISDIFKNCPVDRYGGESIMGAGVGLSPNSDELRRLGLLKKNQIVKVSPSTGAKVVTLEPLSLQTPGVKQIQIQGIGNAWFPNTYVFLEYRRPTGINYRPGMENAIYINLRAGLQNNGTLDIETYQIGYKLTKSNPIIRFPEWGLLLQLQQITTGLATISVEYI